MRITTTTITIIMLIIIMTIEAFAKLKTCGRVHCCFTLKILFPSCPTGGLADWKPELQKTHSSGDGLEKKNSTKTPQTEPDDQPGERKVRTHLIFPPAGPVRLLGGGRAGRSHDWGNCVEHCQP